MIDELDCLCVPDPYFGLLFSSHAAAATSSLHSAMFDLRETSDGSGSGGKDPMADGSLTCSERRPRKKLNGK